MHYYNRLPWGRHSKPGALLMNHYFQNALTAGLLRTLAIMPYGLVARMGETLGKLLYKLPSRRKRILHTNLELCFPEQSAKQRQALAQSTFGHVIRSYLERGTQWYGSAKQIEQLVQLESAIELQDNYGQPSIFLGFHFAAIEATCMYYSIMHPVA
ncbi:lipid A biosynthesis lauroyl acyltransferase, partial [Parapusillimonas granuli]|nr:lipid A biosynthesis lauroyl acyltransferase [Parapusillimonas granuli]